VVDRGFVRSFQNAEYTENTVSAISINSTISKENHGGTHMPTVTVNVDEDLKAQMDDHPEINWSEVVKNAFKEKIDNLEIMERLSSDSELTEEDVDELAELIDTNVAQRLAER
jgi:hypothetical protein